MREDLAFGVATTPARGWVAARLGLKYGTWDGEPGPRQAAMTTYFGAIIIDRDGNKIEAVSFPAQK
jgi:hypothetical protein